MNTTDADFKPTPGPWERSLNTSQVNSEDDAILKRYETGAVKFICRVYGEGFTSKNVHERDSNAALIVEAGTVYHETGKTPRRLADENAELLAALERLLACPAMNEDCVDPETDLASVQAYDAINKAKGVGK